MKKYLVVLFLLIMSTAGAQNIVYTLHFDKVSTDETGKREGGSAIFTIDTNGNAVLKGKKPDGTPFNFSFKINYSKSADFMLLLSNRNNGKDRQFVTPFVDGTSMMYGDERSGKVYGMQVKSSNPSGNAAVLKKIQAAMKSHSSVFGGSGTGSRVGNSTTTPAVLLPLTLNGRSSGYRVTVPATKNDQVYPVRTRNGQYVKDTKLGDYSATSDSYWARVRIKTEAAIDVDFDENNTGSQRTAIITVSAGGTNTSMTVVQPALAAKIDRVWVEHNKMQGLTKGMKIHVSFQTLNMRGKQGQLGAYFFLQNGNRLIDYNGYYRSVEGQVCTYLNFVPSYDNTTFSDAVLFIPYTELHLRGTVDCKFNVIIHVGGQMTVSDFVGFRVTL